MRLALWTPRPFEGAMAVLVSGLERAFPLEVCAGPGTAPAADLHLFHVDDRPEHEYVLGALRSRPGVVLLAEWNLHRLARAEALSRGGWDGYRMEARRAHGEAGVFAARQHARGGASAVLRSLFPLNDRVLEASLGLVAFTRAVAARAAARLPGRPVAHVPLSLVAGHDPIDPAAGRTALGLRRDEPLVVAVRPRDDPAPPERTRQALAGLGAGPPLAVRWTSAEEPGSGALLAAANVVVALEHPVRAGLDPAIVTAMAAGRPVLVTAGGGAAAEFPEGVVVPVSPGRTEAEELRALVARLLGDEDLRERIGRLARTFLAEQGDPDRLASGVLDVVRSVGARLDAALAAWRADRPEEGSLAALAAEEVRWGARDLGLVGLPLGLGEVVAGLFGKAPR
jgi:hypothetical protein